MDEKCEDCLRYVNEDLGTIVYMSKPRGCPVCVVEFTQRIQGPNTAGSLFPDRGPKQVEKGGCVRFVVGVTVSLTRAIVMVTLPEVLAIFHDKIANISAILRIKKQASA